MDTAVALVQAYLHVNGYFTVVEHPVLESLRAGQVRTVTDLDVLAYRLPGAGHDLIHGRSGTVPQRLSSEVDPALGAPTGRADMIVGEVKEGRARLNPALRDPATLEVALARFGCCPAEEARDVSRRLLDHGRAATRAGHEIRVVAFGGTPGQVEPHNPWTTVPMNHVVEYLQAYLHAHWQVLRHAQIHDEGLAVLALMEKWGLGHNAADRLPVP
ncbi:MULTISPECIES: hypothetical protein [Nocardioides]|uniref:Uncharacterized protein n=1 Tax=Nocardioides caricicola TaxID=634770 RepID=A0ABW0N500_9ACTN|nr:hypothetical protein [Nocardioides aequoreus]